MSEQKDFDKAIRLRQQMILNREIERCLDELIRAAGEKACLLSDDKAMRESQLRNVLSVAVAHPLSHLTVSNFIYYQIGRSGVGHAWMHNNFGKQVVKDIQDADGIVSKLANQVADAVHNAVTEANRDEVRQDARGQLLRLYLGYLNRWFSSGSKARDWQGIENLLKEGRNV